MPRESLFIKGSEVLNATKSLLPLLESEENYTKQTGKEQIKVEKPVTYLCTKQNKIKQNQEKMV